MVDRTVPLLNQQQKYAYDTLMKVVNDGSGGFYFLDAPGGIGKTFLLSFIFMNFQIQEKIAGELQNYKSVDSIPYEDEVDNYPTEFLNSLELPGLPPHNLQLKSGSVIIMLRNIIHPHLCYGTWLAVKKLLNVIEATILKEKYKSEDVLIPLIPNDIERHTNQL